MNKRQVEGRIARYSPERHSGVVRGEDRIQYVFQLSDVHDAQLALRIQSRSAHAQREHVAFLVDGYSARAITSLVEPPIAAAQALGGIRPQGSDNALRPETAPTLRGTSVYHDAKAAVDLGQPELAIGLFERAIRERDNPLSAVKDLASTYLMLERSADAIELLKNFVDSPDLPAEERQRFRNLLENARTKAAKERKVRRKAQLELERSAPVEDGSVWPTTIAAQISQHLASRVVDVRELELADVDSDIDELCGRHFIGVVYRQPTNAAPGIIRAYHELYCHARTSGWRVHDDDGQKDLGPSSLVEWSTKESIEAFPMGTLVHFVVGERTSDYGVIGDTAPWYSALAEVGRLGALIVPTPENFWTKSDRRVPYQDPGLTVYCAANGTLTGPWQVVPDTSGGTLAPLSQDGTVEEILVENLEPDMIVEIENQEYLLPCRTVPISRMVDVRASQELTEWLISSLSSVSGEVVERLDESHPQWRSDLENSINSLSDPGERAVFLARWQRVEPIIEALGRQNDTFQRLLNDNPTLQGLLQTNLRHALDQARSDILSKAEAETAELLAAQTEVLTRLRDEVLRLEARAHALEQAKPLPAVIETKSQIGDRRSSVPTTFHLALAARMLTRISEVTGADAETFHLASLACRCLLVPSCAWVKAYFETFSPGSANLTNLVASPMWLSLEDVWRGGLATAWEQALENPERIYLVQFTNFNCSMVDYWAPLLLLSSADLSTQLTGMSPAAWPNNLRTFWSPAPPSTSFGLSSKMAGAFGAVGLSPDETSPPSNFDRPDVLVKSENSAVHWLECAPGVQNAKNPPASSTKMLGEYARSATDDIARMVQAGTSLALPMTEDKATWIRVQGPSEIFRRLEGRNED